MGGNVVVVDVFGKKHKAEKISFLKLDREKFVNDFSAFFKQIHLMCRKITGGDLWPHGNLSSLLSSGVIFSGSSFHLFDGSLSNDEFIEYCPITSDIDVMVPEENLNNLFKLLKSIHGTNIIPNVRHIGQKKISNNNQLSTLFLYFQDKKTAPVSIQIDWRGVPYENNKPSDFSRFSASSDWEDIKSGIKGVFHKYLLRSISRVVSKQKNAILLTPMSSIFPFKKIKISKSREPIRLFSFSVEKGLRTCVEKQYLSNGSPFLINGKNTFKKLSTDASIYQREKSGIFSLLFGVSPIGNEMKLFCSFNGLLQLMHEHFSDEQIMDVYTDFVESKLYGKRSQALDAYNPQNDMRFKMSAINAFREKFDFLSRQDEMVDYLIHEYYKNYRIRTIEDSNPFDKDVFVPDMTWKRRLN